MGDSKQNWRIDVHHHVVPPQYADDSMPIKVPDIETQLQSMDKWQIRTAITSLTPRVILKNMNRLREVARICNEFQARMVLEHPSRFGSFALLPLPDVDGALEEITYALDILHLDGVGLFSSVNDRYLGDPLFDPVFDELNRRNAVVFIHPTHCEAPQETNLGAPPFVVEYVFDTTRAIVNLIFTGTLKRYPDIRSSSRTGAAQCRFWPKESRCSRDIARPRSRRRDSHASRAILRDRQHHRRIRAAFTARACRPNAHTLGFGPAFRLRRAAAGGSGSLGRIRWLQCRPAHGAWSNLMRCSFFRDLRSVTKLQT